MRLVTRGDFDSLISATLLQNIFEIDEIKISHPTQIQECKFTITENDILANLPYHTDCGYWFDHHPNETSVAENVAFKGAFMVAESCSRTIFETYKSNPDIARLEGVVAVADKIDSANFTIEEVQNPHGWYIIDRTLRAFDPKGRLGDFREYFMLLMEWINTISLKSILFSDEVLNRIEHVRSEHKLFINALYDCTDVEKNVIITDSRKIRYFPNGNRYLIYSLYPEQNVSLSIFNRRDNDTSVIFCGHNIFNRTCTSDIGILMQKYGGNGRRTAGSCEVKKDEADSVLNEIKGILQNGANI